VITFLDPIASNGGSLGLVTVTKTGAGTVIFHGSSPVYAKTEVNAGAFELATSATYGLRAADVGGSAPSSFTVGPGATLLGGAAGKVRVDEFTLEGTLDLGTNFTVDSPSLTINGGTIRTLADTTFPIPDRATIDTLGATIDSNGFNSTFSGTYTGPGGLSKIGSGTIILTGDSTYSGGTNFNGGILAVEGSGHLGTGPLTFNGGTLEDLTGFNLLSDVDIELGPAGGTFLADPATTSALNGTISGPGSFTKTGPGTLILTGNNTFSGGTTIDDGTLVVRVPAGSGSLTSFALGTGNVFLIGGTLRTTNLDPQPLIINIGGNYTQGPSGTLALGIGGLNGSQYDHVLVGGNAFLNGTLAVSSLNGFRPANLNAFQVLHANGNRNGQFAQVEDSLNNNPNLFRSDFYFANAVVLFYKTAPAFPSTIVIPSRIAPPDPNAPLSLSFLVEALDPSAAQLTSLYQVGFTGAWLQRSNLDDRLFQLQQAYVPPPPVPPAPITDKET